MRNDRIDILRFIGLAMIILTHSDPSTIILQIRSFDVPLIVLVSGMSFAISYKKEKYVFYLWKRIKRLLFPVWIFLTALFAFIYSTGYFAQLISPRIVASSYLLISGIGYVWIIRVFLMVALVAPAIFNFSENTKSHSRYFMIIGAVYICHELLLLAPRPNLGLLIGSAYENTVLYILPYSAIFAIGLRFLQLSKTEVIRLSIGSLTVTGIIGTALFAVTGNFHNTFEYKFPPSIYYLSYALGVSGLIYLASDKIIEKIKSMFFYPFIMFIAQNSIWVYLWHIPLIKMIHFPSYYKYPFLFAVASIIAYVQVIIVRQVLMPRTNNLIVKKNLNILFTG